MEMGDFAAYHNFRMYKAQGFQMLWHGLMLSDGRNVDLEL